MQLVQRGAGSDAGSPGQQVTAAAPQHHPGTAMDPEAFLDLANQVTKLKMFPYFDIAHSVLCALHVREDLGPGKPRHPSPPPATPRTRPAARRERTPSSQRCRVEEPEEMVYFYSSGAPCRTP